MNQQYYSVEEMKDVLGIGRTTAYNLVHSENFPSITVGKRILIPAEALERWTESKLQESEE